jgi:hypothetical protein
VQIALLAELAPPLILRGPILILVLLVQARTLPLQFDVCIIGEFKKNGIHQRWPLGIGTWFLFPFYIFTRASVMTGTFAMPVPRSESRILSFEVTMCCCGAR